MKYSKNIVEFNDDKFFILINYFLPQDENHIFNTIDFFNIHSNNELDKYIQLVRKTDNKVYACIAFYWDSQRYLSPKKGTFGGISCWKDIDSLLLEKFLENSIKYIELKNPKSISIKLQPLNQNNSLNSIVTNILLRLNFNLVNYDLNYYLSLNHHDFLSNISQGNKKKINKCKRDNLKVYKVNKNDYQEVFNLISKNRELKKYPLSMSYLDFDRMFRTFPDKILCFAVSLKGQMVAASICISITEKILYVFYWGDLPLGETYSPTVYLANYIYDFAKKNNYILLDIGTSTENNIPNYSLMNFKKKLGFNESLKFKFEKILIK
jgi:hypothetical protein